MKTMLLPLLLLLPAVSFAAPVGKSARKPTNSVIYELPAIKEFDSARPVIYDSSKALELDVSVGYHVHLVFEEGESVKEHAFGDGQAWGFADYNNHVFIKPTDEFGTTNLTIVTNKRFYQLRLNYVEKRKKGMVYTVVYRYPDSTAAKKKVDLEKQELKKALDQAPAQANWKYSMAGAAALAPISVSDDGTFTHFTFAENVDVPTIFMVNPDGTESRVDRHAAGAGSETVVVQRVAKSWMLRRGTSVLAIYNDNYDAYGIANTSGTTIPGVERVILNGDE